MEQEKNIETIKSEIYLSGGIKEFPNRDFGILEITEMRVKGNYSDKERGDFIKVYNNCVRALTHNKIMTDRFEGDSNARNKWKGDLRKQFHEDEDIVDELVERNKLRANWLNDVVVMIGYLKVAYQGEYRELINSAYAVFSAKKMLKVYNTEAVKYNDLTTEQKIEMVHQIENSAVDFLRILIKE